MGCDLHRWTAVAAVLVVGLSARGGSQRTPLRIGVVVDCQGAYRSLQDVELSGAQLPLMVRGAQQKGREPSDGIENASAGGAPVELVPACSESGELSTLTQAVRLLIERKRVDVVVVGGPYTVDGIALRTVARRYPRVAFIAAANGPREVTLQGAPVGLYRVAADYEQGAAGLATYAYRRLGWRRAAIVVDPWVAGWGAETAFVREFCALGGRIARRIPVDPSLPYVAVPRGVDGVAVLASSFFLKPKPFRRLAQGQGDAPRRMLLGPEVAISTDLLTAAGPSIDGVVGAAYTPPVAPSPEVRSYVKQFARFYGAPAAQAQDPLVVNYRNAMEAVLVAFERAGGDQRRLRGELDRLRVRLLGVPVSMDAHRQATVDTTLVRVSHVGLRSGPSRTKVQTVPGVDQSIGGLVPATYEPTHLGQACKRATPPAWAK